jgi:hypothetical protein
MGTVLKNNYCGKKESKFELVRYRKGENPVAYLDFFEVKNPPLGKKSFIVYYENDMEGNFFEIETFENAGELFFEIFDVLRNGGSFDFSDKSFKSVSFFTITEKARKPWFYATPEDEIIGDFAFSLKN